jgi:exodeoxyribonuclease VII small subunit
MTTPPPPPTFEEALRELQTIVTQLEDGDLTLEASLQLYERGQQLAKACQQYLEAAHLRVEMLTEDGEILTIAV